MKARNFGRIVNIASIAGKEGNPNASAYAAAKAGVIGMTKARRQGSGEIRHRHQLSSPRRPPRPAFSTSSSPSSSTTCCQRIPRGRFLEVEEAANMVAWLVSQGKQLYHRLGIRPLRWPRHLLIVCSHHRLIRRKAAQPGGLLLWCAQFGTSNSKSPASETQLLQRKWSLQDGRGQGPRRGVPAFAEMTTSGWGGAVIIDGPPPPPLLCQKGRITRLTK